MLTLEHNLYVRTKLIFSRPSKNILEFFWKKKEASSGYKDYVQEQHIHIFGAQFGGGKKNVNREPPAESKGILHPSKYASISE